MGDVRNKSRDLVVAVDDAFLLAGSRDNFTEDAGSRRGVGRMEHGARRKEQDGG